MYMNKLKFKKENNKKKTQAELSDVNDRMTRPSRLKSKAEEKSKVRLDNVSLSGQSHIPHSSTGRRTLFVSL